MGGRYCRGMTFILGLPTATQKWTRTSRPHLGYLRPNPGLGFSAANKKALFDVQSLMNVVQADLPMTGAGGAQAGPNGARDKRAS